MGLNWSKQSGPNGTVVGLCSEELGGRGETDFRLVAELRSITLDCLGSEFIIEACSYDAVDCGVP
jgi:hypothetical protein